MRSLEQTMNLGDKATFADAFAMADHVLYRGAPASPT
jgi:hypothetical protein